MRIPNDSDVKTHYGFELWPHEMVALRAGFKTGYDEEVGSFGAGIRYLDYQIDYAFLPFSNDSELGDTHRISLNWTPGRATRQ